MALVTSAIRMELNFSPSASFAVLVSNTVSLAIATAAFAVVMAGAPTIELRAGYWLGVGYLAIPASELTFSRPHLFRANLFLRYPTDGPAWYDRLLSGASASGASSIVCWRVDFDSSRDTTPTAFEASSTWITP